MQEDPYRNPASPSAQSTLARDRFPRWQEDPSEGELKLFDELVKSYIELGKSVETEYSGESIQQARARCAVEQADYAVACRRSTIGRR